MQELSVNISGNERAIIKNTARERFHKTAKNRHPDPNFCENITKQIYLESLEKIRPMIESDTLKYVQHVSNIMELAEYQFPQEYRLSMLANEFSYGFLYDQKYLHAIENENINVPNEFKSPGGKYPLALGAYPDINGNIELSESVIDKIDKYNVKMHNTYTEMEKQLDVILGLIDKCTTTKAFNKHLPQLVSLFPSSVKRKLEAKNAPKDHELSEEELLVADATKNIAAAALFDDED